MSSFLCNGYRRSSFGVKRPGRQAGHSHRSTAEVNNKRTCTYTSPYAFKPCRLRNIRAPAPSQKGMTVLKNCGIVFPARLFSSARPKAGLEVSTIVNTNFQWHNHHHHHHHHCHRHHHHRPWVGLGLVQQMSPATSILGSRPPISTTRFPCVFLFPINPSWF